MDDILSQIIAYAPDRIDTETKARALVPGPRIGFDRGGMAKLVSYVEGLPKGATVTLQMVQDYVKKNNLNVNINNFFSRNAINIKDKKFISDTRLKDLKLTTEEKVNIENYGQKKYDKLTDKSDRLRVRQGQDVGSLALDKQQKVKFKKEYDKAIKYYKSRGIDEPNMDSIRKNIARNNGKFNATGTKLQSESGLTGLFKNYEKADLIADLKKGKNLSEISIEYLDKNEKQVLKMLEGKRDYTKPLGRLSTDLSNIISGDEEATKLYNKIKKTNSFNKLKNKSTYKKAVETLIPFAQEQGLIPNVNLKGKKINTASDYFNYAYKVKKDPIAKLFGFYERVGIEHPGGVARALIFDDPATLNEIVATMPDTNFAAGSTYDTYATGQARFFEKTRNPKYIKKINQIILNKQKEYGKPRTILDVDGDDVTRRTTKFSLTNPNLIEDSKSFINEYVAAGGSKRKNFNKLDPSLQKSILAFEEGNKIKGNKFLKIALKDTGAEADFKNITKKINTDLLKLAGTKNKKCKGLLSYGGRVGLAEGLSPEFCINEGRKVAQKALFEEGATPAQKSIARRLISTGGKIALSMLNPKELIRLSNLVGPGALGLMGLYEAGSITDDVLRLNKPLDEALAGNWLTKSFLPYSEEFAKQKNLLQSGQLAGDQKEYALEMMKMENFVKEGQRIEGMAATKLLDNSDYGNIDGSPMVSKEDMNKAYAGMFGRLMRMKPYMFEEGITGRSLENEAAMNEYQDSRLAKTGKYTSAISEDKFRLPGQRQIKQDENYEFASSPIFGEPQPMVNKAPRPKNMGRGPMTEKNRMNLDFSIPGYTPYDKTYTPTDEETLQIYRNQGIVPPTTGYLAPGEGTKLRMGLASQGGNRSIYGSKFMEGGIASLNVNKK